MSFSWQGDTLRVGCKDTYYYIARTHVEQADHFCWQQPLDGQSFVVDGIFAFISNRALAELKKNGAFTYDDILWQRIDDSADDSIIHVKAPATGTEMWIDAESPLPLVLELRNNPFGIEWRVKTPPSLPKGEESQVAGRNGTTSYTQGWMSMSSVCSIMSMSVGKSLVSKSPVMQRVVSEAVSCTPY